MLHSHCLIVPGSEGEEGLWVVVERVQKGSGRHEFIQVMAGGEGPAELNNTASWKADFREQIRAQLWIQFGTFLMQSRDGVKRQMESR
jgi:hypothetical protein